MNTKAFDQISGGIPAGTMNVYCSGGHRSAVDTILAASESIKDLRDLNSVMMHVMEEVGELATEVAIQTGASYKQPGPDGIIGEACDAIISLVDLIYLVQPSISEQEIKAIISNKLAKWSRKVNENNKK